MSLYSKTKQKIILPNWLQSNADSGYFYSLVSNELVLYKLLTLEYFKMMNKVNPLLKAPSQLMVYIR